MATVTYQCPDDPDGCPRTTSPGFCAVHPAAELEAVRATAFADAPADRPEAGRPPVTVETPLPQEQLHLRFLDRVVPIPALGMRLGRECGPLADLPGMAELTQVSRQHATLYPLNGHLYVRDDDSTNHTYVDGRMVVTPQRLRAGQVLRLGQDVELRVEAAGFDEFGLPL
ncbi:FHA domain-containing protein [Lentzea chajnantorensis]